MINQQNNLCLFPTKDPASIREGCKPAPYTSPEVWNLSTHRIPLARSQDEQLPGWAHL
jgi:hypothetical protein